MAIDNLSDHHVSAGLRREAAGTHIGIFLAWVILNGLQNAEHDDENSDELEAVRSRQMSGREFLLRVCDGKLWDEDLNDEGNRFAAAYYWGEGEQIGGYLSDYQEALARELPTMYHVADTWSNYDAVASTMDKRLADWRATST